ncbi:MAG: tripartite tricarboxylate transporter substrate binding protein [Xanthobacteraceae bacterium]|nr:tripartite tricarboxylate transporter substrate binding protein [Xanthobacteraceae bacterium]
MRPGLPLRYALLALTLAAMWPEGAAAQTYPSRPIRLIVPFPPGGAADILARLIGNKVAEQTGQPLVVENRPGAGGTLGADAAAKSPPDGYTILHNTNGAAIAPALYRTLPFDGVKDFAPVTQIVASNLVLVAGPKSGIESVKDLLTRARANPGKLNYGSSGPGNPLHLTMEMLKHAAGVDIVAVPFRGDGQIHAALIGGEVEVAVIPLSAAVPLIQEGRLKALAVTGPKRSQPVADVPTVAEAAGLPGFASAGWQGWFMPAATPASMVERIRSEVARAVALPEINERLRAMAYEPMASAPADFRVYFQAEVVKFTKIIADARIAKQ